MTEDYKQEKLLAPYVEILNKLYSGLDVIQISDKKLVKEIIYNYMDVTLNNVHKFIDDIDDKIDELMSAEPLKTAIKHHKEQSHLVKVHRLKVKEHVAEIINLCPYKVNDKIKVKYGDIEYRMLIEKISYSSDHMEYTLSGYSINELYYSRTHIAIDLTIDDNCLVKPKEGKMIIEPIAIN
jgi:hypothetical protein